MDTEFLTENCALIFRKREHCCFGISPFNSYFSEELERNFPNLSRPKIQRDDYVQWDWNEKYIVWVKRMGTNDLQDDPFNAYSASDDGTIRVAVELDIHGE